MAELIKLARGYQANDSDRVQYNLLPGVLPAGWRWLGMGSGAVGTYNSNSFIGSILAAAGVGIGNWTNSELNAMAPGFSTIFPAYHFYTYPAVDDPMIGDCEHGEPKGPRPVTNPWNMFEAIMTANGVIQVGNTWFRPLANGGGYEYSDFPQGTDPNAK